MKKGLAGVLFLWILIAAGHLCLGQKKFKESDLPEKYREWLNIVAYIILPQEKDVFLRLQNDFERDIFIESFWKQRDPTPGTPQNEYKEEIYKRWNYVNKEFRKDTPRPGWMTDRGRIYMILGEPKSRESITARDLQPCELWTYYGDVSKGQPSLFGLLFFRRGGSGEYKLYSPMVDGPKSLIIKTPSLDLNVEDPWEIYAWLREYYPTIAPFILSVVPHDPTLGVEPSTYSEIILAEILDAPRKEVNPSYATHFLDYKGIVTTEYLTNFVDSDALVAVFRDPVEGIPFLHYSIVPKSISFDYYEPKNQYFCNYIVDVSLKKDNDFIYQASKNFTYYFSPEESPLVTANGIAIQDCFPAIEGRFKLTILLRNTVGKEFSLVEREVEVEKENQPRIAGPVLAYRLEDLGQANFLAFKVLNDRVLVEPKSTFTLSDTIFFFFNLENMNRELWERGEVRISVQGTKKESPGQKNFILRLNRQPFQAILHVIHSFPASDLAPDYYEMTVSLVDGENVLDRKRLGFVLTDVKALARPVILSKSLPRSSVHLRYLELAGQAEKAGEPGAAEAYFQRALALAPFDPEVAVYYCGFLMRSKNFSRVFEHIEKVKADPTLQFDYYLIKGKALRELGRCEEAIPVLLEGNKIYNSDTRLLNALGYCFYKTGQKSRAVEVLRASLRLNPEQEEVKRLIEEINRN